MRNRLIKIILVVTYFCYSLGGPGCEYSCNQHGYCEKGRCKCVPPWTGPDCSVFTCPTGFDWGGNHTQMVECSGRGICTKSGCKCYNGFSGVSCQILDCPTDIVSKKVCSGHGKCLSVKQHSKLSFVNWKCDVTTPTAPGINYYLESDVNGDSWDANRIFGCECEGGWTGYDCSIKVCPYGAVNNKDKPDTTSYVINPLNSLVTEHKIKDGKLIIPAKWSLFIKNCEDDDSSGTICKAHNITVPCNITFIELRDIIRQDGIVKDIVIYSTNEECDRLSCKGDISFNNDYSVRFIFVVDKSAGLVQITDELYDRTVTTTTKSDKSHIINGYCIGRYESTTPTTPTPTPAGSSLLYTITAPVDKLYMECSGLADCINGICEKCYAETETRNSYLLKDYIINKPNVRNCQIKRNDEISNEDTLYCAYGGIFDDTAEKDDEISHSHCVCNNKYTGYTCNKRSCNDLKATTFYGYAYENNKGHLPEACSGEGNCGTSGCLCREGFTGGKCNKLKCGNKVSGWMVSNPRSECSGRGDCIVASDYLSDYDGWDRDSIGICDCKDGYTGYNCEDRKCPYGPDPLDYYNLDYKESQLPGAPFIDIYDQTNKLDQITGLHFVQNDLNGLTNINTINALNNALLNSLGLKGPISYYTCTNSGDSCSKSITLGDGNNGKWKKLESTDTTNSFPIAAKTHLRIYLHHYCVEDLRKQTIKPDKESYIQITAEFNTASPDTKTFGINEGRFPCYECSNQGICNRMTGICTCLGRYSSSGGVDENGNIIVGSKGDCSYLSPDYYRETEV